MLLPGPFHCVLRSLEFKDAKAGHEGLTSFWPETTEEVKRLISAKMETAGISTRTNVLGGKKLLSSKKLKGVMGFELKSLSCIYYAT